MSEPPRSWLGRLRDFFGHAAIEKAIPADPASGRSLRIGIDVGGTFTHAVALDAATLALTGRIKVPTTHFASEGVAAGVLEALSLLIADTGARTDEIGLIAHSTTQATNALLEGDVATVGILGMGRGPGSWLASRATRIGQLELAPGRYLETVHRFLDVGSGIDETAVLDATRTLESLGARAFVVSAAFGVDDPEAEARAVDRLRADGRLACAGHEISQLYGLRARTRTAAINACMLPRMVETAEMTERAVRAAGIMAPLMVMRSDGGVMTLAEMRRRPILTMLSGPAAGVAAAMMAVRLSDGIFLEIGGTSTDISVIRNGKAQVKAAELGGNRLYLRTLDVRTVGVAGGSMVRIARPGRPARKTRAVPLEPEGQAAGGLIPGSRPIAVGPRSAHIAGLAYAAFPKADLKMGEVTTLAPRPGDPADYLALRTGRDVSHTLTTTCAANFLGLVPEGDCARGDAESVRLATERVARAAGMEAEELATRILHLATDPLEARVKKLISDYRLDRRLVTLMGGGGGAAALVPYLARRMGLRFALADNADVISAIGVALAMVRETIERNLTRPTNDDLLRLRREAEAAVLAVGAAAGTVEVQIEIDSARNIVRAVATGATELRTREMTAAAPSPEELRAIAAHALDESVDAIDLMARTDGLEVWGTQLKESRWRGLLKRERMALRVIDPDGVIRLQTNRGAVLASPAGDLSSALAGFLEEHAHFGDGGKEIPDCFVLQGRKLLDLSGLLDASQVVSLAMAEIEGVASDEPIVVVGALRH